jgi:tetratricopeptide (TPR) repeat protein
MSMNRLALLFAAVSALAACSTAPAPPATTDEYGYTPARQPGAAPAAPAVAAPPAAPAAPASPAAQQQAQRTAQAAIELLEAGNEDQALAELRRALGLDPNNRLAHNLMRQITVDPVATLGRESFPYTVRPSDTLSRISGRFLGDIYAFYILARYNDIKVPKQVAGGQVIRIPGKAPPPGALEREAPPRRADPAPTPAVAPTAAVVTPAPVPAPAAPPPPPEPTPGERAVASADAAQRSGDLDRALTEYRRAVGLDQPSAAAKAEQVRRQLVSRHSTNARSAFAKQDLDGAIRNWERVLELDPGNDTARLERQKSLALKEKFKSLK